MPAKGADLIETEAPRQEPRFAAPDPGPAGVAISAVTKSFRVRRGAVQALAELSLGCAEREVLGIVGPSGCGKSTLLELICGLEQPSSGAVSVGGASAP